MAGLAKAEGALRLALWITTPQVLALLVIAMIQQSTGVGLGLVLLVIAAVILSALIAVFLWKLLMGWRNPPPLLAGGFVGLVAGLLGGGLMLLAFAAEPTIGPLTGGSFLGAAIRSGVAQGAAAASEPMNSSGLALVDAMMLPVKLGALIGGGLGGFLIVVALVLGCIALPVLGGLIGGFSAGLAARRAARQRPR